MPSKSREGKQGITSSRKAKENDDGFDSGSDPSWVPSSEKKGSSSGGKSKGGGKWKGKGKGKASGAKAKTIASLKKPKDASTRDRPAPPPKRRHIEKGVSALRSEQPRKLIVLLKLPAQRLQSIVPKPFHFTASSILSNATINPPEPPAPSNPGGNISSAFNPPKNELLHRRSFLHQAPALSIQSSATPLVSAPLPSARHVPASSAYSQAPHREAHNTYSKAQQVKDQKIRNLTATNLGLKQELEDKGRELEEKDRELQAVKEKLADSEMTRHHAMSQLHDLEVKYRKLEFDYSQALNTANMGGLTNEKFRRLQKNTDNLQKKLTALQNENAELSETISLISEKYSHISRAISESSAIMASRKPYAGSSVRETTVTTVNNPRREAHAASDDDHSIGWIPGRRRSNAGLSQSRSSVDSIAVDHPLYSR